MLKILLCFLFIASCVHSPDDELPNGSVVPNIVLKDTSGQEQSLVTLRGKYVLIDFWASWCGDCLRKNPELIQIYDQYKSSNQFEIFSVSLDEKWSKWHKSIGKYDLHWPYHVVDLDGFNSVYLDSFHFSSIPALYLIDDKGVLIGKNLSTKQLQQELNQRIKP